MNQQLFHISVRFKSPPEIFPYASLQYVRPQTQIQNERKTVAKYVEADSSAKIYARKRTLNAISLYMYGVSFGRIYPRWRFAIPEFWYTFT